MTRLKAGDKVFCRFYNSCDKRFAQESWIGEIIEINSESKEYIVKKPDYGNVRLKRKEIRCRA